MKRLLVRAAGEDTSLYHGTSSDSFISIINAGMIDVSGNVSNGFMKKDFVAESYDLASNNTSDNITEMTLYDLWINRKGDYSTTGLKYTKSLQDYIFNQIDLLRQQIKKDNFPGTASTENISEIDKQALELAKEMVVQVGIITGDGPDSNVVFVGTKEVATMYAGNSTNHGNTPTGPYVFGVLLKVRVDTDALGPDLNDSQVSKDSDVLPWKQTLNNIGQCLHRGPIYTDQIEEVTFIHPKDVDYKIKSSNKFKLNTAMTFEESIDMVNYFYNSIEKKRKKYYDERIFKNLNYKNISYRSNIKGYTSAFPGIIDQNGDIFSSETKKTLNEYTSGVNVQIRDDNKLMFIQPDFSIITNTENFKLNLKNEFNNYSIQVGVENLTVDDFINKYIDNNTIGKTTKRLLKKYSD